MKKLLPLCMLLVAIVAMRSHVSAKGGLKNLWFPSSATHPEHEITLQKTWGWGSSSYKGFLITVSDLERFTRFQVELAIMDKYIHSTHEKELLAPDGVSLLIEGLGTIDLSGVELAHLQSVTSRRVLIFLPALSVPVFQRRSHFSVRKGLQIGTQVRVGIGYEIRAFIDESEYTVTILVPEDGGSESITLPYTNSGTRDGVALPISTIFEIGFLHIEGMGVYTYPRHFRYTLGAGARW